MSYHSIYFPFTDIYLLAGPEVFEELQAKEEGQRNLLVFPSMFGKELDPDTKTGNTWGMEGGKQVNRFLKNLKGVKLADSEARQEMSQDHVGQNQEPTKGITIYRVNDGLDIAYIDYANFSSDVFKVSRLIDRVEDIWRAEKGPIILTTVDRYHTKYGSRGIEVQEPHFMVVNEDIVNQGIIEGTPELLAELYGRSREVPIGTVEEALQKEWMKHLFNNQFVRFVDPSKRSYVYGRITGELQRSKSGTRVTGIDNVVLRLLQDKEYSMKLKMGTAQMDTLLGIRPLNMEQYLVMRYGLMNLTDVPLIFLVGQQGSGKTILAYAAAVDQILVYDKQYRAQRGMAEDNDKSGFHDRMVLFKPHEIMGGRKREVGFQPGDLFEKLRDDLEPFENAHEETLLGEYDVPFEDMVMNKNSKNRWGMGRSKQEKALPFASLPRKAPLKIMYSGGVRGASLVRTVMLIDEAQNFTPYEVKTLLGRLAKGSCAIVCGDTEQLDNPMCTREVNGLTAAISFFLPQHYSLLVNLSENQRHQISEDTTKWKVYSR